MCVAMPFGSPGNEKIVLNVDSLWAGGPFGATVRHLIWRKNRYPEANGKQNYTGGNPSEEKYTYLSGIRDWIFQNTTGSMYTVKVRILC